MDHMTYNAAIERAARVASTWHNGNPVEVEICELIAKAILSEKIKDSDHD